MEQTFDHEEERAVRTYAPASTETVLARLLEEPSLAAAVMHHATLPPREAITAPFPAWLDRRIVQGLEDRGITSLYSHQAEAVEAVHAGEDIVVVTPTASGKTLCYALPVLQALAEDPSARALFLFPTKALGQDQVAEFAGLAQASSLQVAAATYDGDTPAPIRSAIRTAGQVVVTNPDMLHSAILPHHTKWFQLFEQLRFIVIDELHTYRGVFGSHVANVLRRLLRICAHYGSKPVIICCSATIGNPGELAAMLTGRPARLIDRNGAFRTRTVSTKVAFRRLSDAEIAHYVEKREGLGKAGGYAVQGRAAVFARAIIGSYTNVVGLPLTETHALLTACGFTPA